MPDEFASEVISRSEDLFSVAPLEEPDGGHVLWINPSASGPQAVPFRVLRPMDAVYDRHVLEPSQAQARDAIYAEPFKERPDGARDPCSGEPAPLDAALAIARRFQRFHRGQLLHFERLLGRRAALRLALAGPGGGALVRRLKLNVPEPKTPPSKPTLRNRLAARLASARFRLALVKFGSNRFATRPELLAGPCWACHVLLEVSDAPHEFLKRVRDYKAPLGR